MTKSGAYRNDFCITAKLVKKNDIRYSPAGQTIIEGQLESSGIVVEAGIERKVNLNLLVVVIGELADAFHQMQIGEERNFCGFMAHQSIRHPALVFHITQISH
jgi:primosomal replication protein N